MTEYPTGTLTFLLTDVEGSTPLWEEHPAAMAAALARHDALIASVVTDYQGQVVKPRGEGDSQFIVFPQAVDAIKAAVEIQRVLAAELSDLPFLLKVRIGLHTGTAEWRDGDYYGPVVNRAARIRGLGHGRQTLLSQATAELVRDALSEGATLVDMGPHRLKGLSRPERVYQLSVSGLPQKFPPLQSPQGFAGNLPTPPTPLIGRQQETAEIEALLAQHDTRLVTLTGPGGTGKTRLSLAVGQELTEHFLHGVFFVDLAPITDVGLVASTIARTMGIREGGGRPPLDNLKDYLADKKMLLILDNLEQVIDAAPVVGELLAAAPGIKALATSRIALNLRGEQVYPVDTLRVPPEGVLTVEELQQYEAFQLFVRQAQAVRPSFELNAGNAPFLAGIVRRLDGLPLAVEIAAARMLMLPPAAILQRLDQSLKLLVGGAADLPQRQQTLRETINWSYAMLEPDEQVLFNRLGAIPGGFTLESAEAIANSDGDLDVFAGTEILLANSLIRTVDSVTAEPRFDMLLTIRDFALEQLVAAGQAEAVRQAHAEYFAQQAMVGLQLYGPQALEILFYLDEEHDNLRASLAWALGDSNTPELAARISAFLAWFWYRFGHIHEGREWSERVVEATAGMGGFPEAAALSIAAAMATWEGELDVARQHAEQALPLANQMGDELGLSQLHLVYGVILLNQGQDADAYGHFTGAAELFDQIGDLWSKTTALVHLANVSLGLGEFDQALKWLDEALPQARKIGDAWQIAFCLNNYGEVYRTQGDIDRARDYYQRTEAAYREADAQGDHARLIHTFGYLALHEGDLDQARALFLESLEAFRELGNKRGMAECLAGLAAVAIARGKARWAAPLLSAAETQMVSSGAAWWPADRVEVERSRQQLQDALEDSDFTDLWKQGRQWPLDEAIDYALALED